jgi:hypothetical protein
MSEIIGLIAVVGWIAALYCFIRLREAAKNVAAWKKIADDSRREAISWRDEALRTARPDRRDVPPEPSSPERGMDQGGGG